MEVDGETPFCIENGDLSCDGITSRAKALFLSWKEDVAGLLDREALPQSLGQFDRTQRAFPVGRADLSNPKINVDSWTWNPNGFRASLGADFVDRSTEKTPRHANALVAG